MKSLVGTLNLLIEYVVDISSEPRVKITLLDYGKNKRNIAKLIKLLRRAV